MTSTLTTVIGINPISIQTFRFIKRSYTVTYVRACVHACVGEYVTACVGVSRHSQKVVFRYGDLSLKTISVNVVNKFFFNVCY